MSNAVEFMEKLGVKSDDIQHHGVKGMKWGVRKARSSSGSSSSSENKRPQPKPVRVPNTFRNSPQNRRISDAELRAKVNRLLLEKQYKDLTTSPKGEKFLKTLLKESGQRAAKTLATKAVDAAIGVALDKAAGRATGTNKLLLEAMASGGGKKKNK